MPTSDDFGARPNVGLTYKDKHNVCDWVASAVNEAGWKDRAVYDIKVLQPPSVKMTVVGLISSSPVKWNIYIIYS